MKIYIFNFFINRININNNTGTTNLYILELDNLHATNMLNLYQSDTSVVFAVASDMLIASGLLNFQEPINGEDKSKSATAYTIVEYMLLSKTVNASICPLNGFASCNYFVSVQIGTNLLTIKNLIVAK